MDLTSSIRVMWARDAEAPLSPAQEEEALFTDDESTANKKLNYCEENNENVSPNHNKVSGKILLSNKTQKVRDSASPSRRSKRRTTFSPDQRNLAKQIFKDLMFQAVAESSSNSLPVTETRKSSVSHDPCLPVARTSEVVSP